MSNSNILWLKDNRVFRQINDTVQVLENLPKKVYTMNYDSNSQEIFLEEFSDKFHFDFKIYGMESKLIEHIITTFERTSSNLGVLFHGTKGTGKTITAKIIANKTNLPVIIVNAPYPGLTNFIANINCPCVLFFDEFEKNFNTDKGHDLELLSIMDGVFNSPYRRVFLLTTNDLFINDNFIGRPSRIRYKKFFGNLSTEVIMEYLEDCLVDKTRTQEILNFIDSLAISTIDILKSVVEEINIHKCSINDFKHFINVEQAKYRYFCNYFFPNGHIDSVEKFMELFNEVAEKISKGEQVNEEQLGIYTRTVTSNIPVELLQIGDPFSSYGTVSQPLDKNGVLIVEDRDYCKVYFKILNLDHRPSLYNGNLTQLY